MANGLLFCFNHSPQSRPTARQQPMTRTPHKLMALLPVVLLFLFISEICALTLPSLTPQQQGSLLVLGKLLSMSKEDIDVMANNTNLLPPEIAGEKLTHPSAKNGVSMYQVLYSTLGVNDTNTFASGLLVVPEIPSSGALPLLEYSHYTETDRTEVPSFLNQDSKYLAIYFGSQGYVVAAPDYIGLGDSPGYHPYFHRPTLTNAATDMLRASVQALQQLGVGWNGQLFITGYSEGGSVNMYLQRHIEMNPLLGFTVTASAPMAGPYDLPYSLQTVILHPSDVDPRISAAEISSLLIAYNLVYGGLFSSPEQVFNASIAPHARSAFDGLHTPQEVLQIFNGPPLEVLQPSLVKDIFSNPDDLFMALLGLNNGYKWTDWKPIAPIRFYQGHADTEVPYHNSELAVEWVRSLGLSTELVDLGPNVTHGEGLLLGFQAVLPWFNSFAY